MLVGTDAGPAVVATERGLTPAGNGEPATAVSTPVVPSMVKAQACPGIASLLATYANWPVGSTVTQTGPIPAGNGEPATSVSAPVVPLMVYAETSEESEFAT